MIKRFLFAAVLLITITGVVTFAHGLSVSNIEVSASSSQDQAHLAVDGVISDASRWIGQPGESHWLLFRFPEERRVCGADVYSGWKQQDAIEGFCFQIDREGQWQTIAGSTLSDNTSQAVRVYFDTPLSLSKIRFFTDQPGNLKRVRVREIILWDKEPAPLPRDPYRVNRQIHQAYVNLSGYDRHWPMRFTAPLSPDGTGFEVIEADTETISFSGVVSDGVGDFSDFQQAQPNRDYRIRLKGGELKPGLSDLFRIAPNWLLDTTLELAFRHMVDIRSIAGTHPTAFGGCPWRDGAFYTYEVPSLVLLYLAHPDFFNALAQEIDYAADKARVLDPEFKMPEKSNPFGDHALATVQRYYREIEPLRSAKVPDIVQLIHWGIGYYLVDPKTRDATQDNKFFLNAQVVEWFAYFLYSYPFLGD
ncbi:MAG: hypothetical protein MI702_01315, partial [Chlorobiales bacterium]|nr:hypothetical protein [Chlorobiales bacterium]